MKLKENNQILIDVIEDMVDNDYKSYHEYEIDGSMSFKKILLDKGFNLITKTKYRDNDDGRYLLPHKFSSKLEVLKWYRYKEEVLIMYEVFGCIYLKGNVYPY